MNNPYEVLASIHLTGDWMMMLCGAKTTQPTGQLLQQVARLYLTVDGIKRQT